MSYAIIGFGKIGQAQDAGHVERGLERQTLEEAMEWVWKRQ